MRKIISYSEVCYFISLCLSCNLIEKNKFFLISYLKTSQINWKKVVKISSKHLVLPAIYYNLKKINAINLIPQDLANFLGHISELNSQRNEKIIAQLHRLNKILNENKIKPIFIKGSSKLILNIYENFGERMISDIDFVVSKTELKKTIHVLKLNGYYSDLNKYWFYYPFRHYPRLKNKSEICSVEVHTRLTKDRYDKEFGYKDLSKNMHRIKKFYVPSFSNMVSMSIISDQINDNSYSYKTISLRNAYDVLLLSKKKELEYSINSFDKLKLPIIFFLNVSKELFNIKDLNSSVFFKSDLNNDFFIFMILFKYEYLAKIYSKFLSFLLFFKTRFVNIIKGIFFKNYRIWYLKKLTSLDWYKEKLGF